MLQSRALELLIKGDNVFLTGAPGSGKSFVIERFVETMREKGVRVALTATTGIAANLIGGVTIHSWAGIGFLGRSINKGNLAIVEDRIRSNDILIIDEISMLDGDTLDLLNKQFKKARKDQRAFGGLQVVFVGDFFQLPPVNKPLYAFESACWQELNLRACYLSEQYRQEDDELLEILGAIRERKLTNKLLSTLVGRQVSAYPKDIMMLLTHNSEVDKMNAQRLGEISGTTHSFEAENIGDPQYLLTLGKGILAPQHLVLKVGAKIMFVANNLSAGYANGTQGKVVSFKSGMPVVAIDGSGIKVRVEANTWRYVLDDKTVAEITQLPLKLSWAITIHKSQGMSIDSALVDLRRSFTYGMGYVALSRLKSFNGLLLSGINSRSLQLDPKVFAFDANLVDSKLQQLSSDPNRSSLKTELLSAGVSQQFLDLQLLDETNIE